MMSEPDGGGGRLVDGVALRAGITHFPPFASAGTFVRVLALLARRRPRGGTGQCGGGVGGRSVADSGLEMAAHMTVSRFRDDHAIRC
jgi:hypothetical protein